MYRCKSRPDQSGPKCLPSGVPTVILDYHFTTLSFARFRCAIRDFALVASTSAATSASLIVRSILSGAIPRRIRLSITFFLRSDLAAFLICLASANMSFGIFVITLHYRVSIYGANLIGVLGSSRSAAKSCAVSENRNNIKQKADLPPVHRPQRLNDLNKSRVQPDDRR
jgi:hypothetical protein